MIVAGFGFSSRATLDSLQGALAATGGAPDALATLADKASALAPLALSLNLPLIPVAGPLPETLTQSERSREARGTGSVAEACALAAAGPGAYLLGPRAVSPDRLATCALAEGGQA
ncbi:cobalamin biosynthesis protein [Pararhodobacter aggregans]|uniref:Precorrin methylase n=1 Tax=Pararhodobacter aggregans TaxID=404875 RepID=A0A2T7UJQ7_9RHOB|nr:cobalamin biosynthesis protein [Pararhodobacter aggregans]PTW97531.1 cobalt-precorrin 5A hydrolase [Pararhodobacter aggregans]PVE44908.1 precorrin methylase [Pararhodobacter aggregans]